MSQEKKPAASAPSTPLPAAPVAAPKRSIVSRETTIGMAVAGVFIAMVAAVVVTKTYFKSLNAAAEARNAVQSAPQEPEQPISQAVGARPPAPTQPPLPEFQPIVVNVPPPSPSPAATQVSVPAPEPEKKDAPPVIALDPVVPTIPMKNDAPMIALPPIDEPMTPARKNDAPVIALSPLDEPTAPVRPPAKDDFVAPAKKDAPPTSPSPLDLPPISVDPVEPTIKNPVIVRTGGNEVKKDVPPAIDAPPAIDVPPTIDVPTIKEPAPKIDVPVDPIIKKDPPPINIDPPSKIDLPLVPPAKKDPPTKIEMPSFEPQPKKDTPPAVIDFGPAKKDAPPPPDTQPKAEVKKDGDFDEDLHSLKPNESFRAISKQYYNSEAYAIALQRYNGDHPGRADYVRVPPIWVLEKKYAGDVSGSQARPVNFTQSPAADVAPRNDPVYTVSDNGEMLAEIARKQLGSEDSWKRIWDLNPQLNPAKTVPGGTRLRMPGQ